MFLRHKKSYLAIGAFAIIFLAGILFFENNSKIPYVHAAAAQNVRGFAWSENIGWISFNSLNCDTDNNGFIDTNAMVSGCGGDNATDQMFDYGVSLDVNPASPTFNNLSGYAWSENIGWIKFNPSGDFTTGLYPNCTIATCPIVDGGNPNYSAKYNPGSKKITGWARACAGTVNGDCNSAARTDGWDGWILLGPINKAVSNDGVWIDNGLIPNEFKGWAWGGEVVGWVSFNHLTGGSGTEYKVYLAGVLNTPPTVIPAAPSVIDYCIDSPQNIVLSWSFNDPEDGINQTAYQIIVTRDDGVLYDSGKVPGLAGKSTSVTGVVFGFGFMDYGYSYAWTIQVWDSGDLSDPAGPRAGAPFSTPAHKYPDADFTYVLPSPSVGLPVNFTDASVAYGGEIIKKWTWDFGDTGSAVINNPPAANGDTSHTYAAAGSYVVTLTVEDSTPPTQGGPFICSASQTLNLANPNLQWEEVTP